LYSINDISFNSYYSRTIYKVIYKFPVFHPFWGFRPMLFIPRVTWSRASTPSWSSDFRGI